MTWTNENVATLRRLWGEGKTAAQIAKELGGISRNAVIGKAHRLKLSTRPSPLPKRKNNNYESLTHVRAKAQEPPASINGKNLEDLKPGDCRWPIGDPPAVVFCSAPIEKGVYCENHNAIAYSNQKRNEDGTEKHSGVHRQQKSVS